MVLETLEALGVDTLFGTPGQHVLSLFNELGDSPIRYISSRVENNAAYATDGYARMTGNPGVLFVSTGLGALISLAGLQESYSSGVPILVVSSQIPEDGLGGRRKGYLHQLDDQRESARNVTKFQSTVHRADGIVSTLVDTWSLALAPPLWPGLGRNSRERTAQRIGDPASRKPRVRVWFTIPSLYRDHQRSVWEVKIQQIDRHHRWWRCQTQWSNGARRIENIGRNSRCSGCVHTSWKLRFPRLT